MEEIEGYQKSSVKSTPPHRHNYYTIIWVKKGKGTHFIDFRKYEVKPDTIYFLTPEQVHDLQLEKGARGYVLLFTPDFTMEYGLSLQFIENTGFFFRCDDLAPFHIPPGVDSSNLEHLVHHIRDEFNGASTYYLDAIGSWLKLFLLECKRLSVQVGQSPEPRTNTRAVLVKQFRDLLENNYNKWHKVADYARELHITPNYLNEILSIETGTSAKDFILDRIMLEAKRYAGFAELSAKEVAYTLGFDDPSHFSKLFRQHQNRSFTDFREETRKKYQ
jgi:AraC-like DNA-binding protein